MTMHYLLICYEKVKNEVLQPHDRGNVASGNDDWNMVSFGRFGQRFSDKSATTLNITALVVDPDQTILFVPQPGEVNS